MLLSEVFALVDEYSAGQPFAEVSAESCYAAYVEGLGEGRTLGEEDYVFSASPDLDSFCVDQDAGEVIKSVGPGITLRVVVKVGTHKIDSLQSFAVEWVREESLRLCIQEAIVDVVGHTLAFATGTERAWEDLVYRKTHCELCQE